MSQHDQSRKFVDKSAASANDVLKGKAEQSAQAIEQSYSATVEKMRNYNIKMIEVAQANTAGVFEFARQLSAAKSPSDLVELWTDTPKSKPGCSANRSRSCQHSDRNSLEKAPRRWRTASPRFSRKPLQKRASDGGADSLSRRCEVSGRSLLSPNREIDRVAAKNNEGRA